MAISGHQMFALWAQPLLSHPIKNRENSDIKTNNLHNLFIILQQNYLKQKVRVETTEATRHYLSLHALYTNISWQNSLKIHLKHGLPHLFARSPHVVNISNDYTAVLYVHQRRKLHPNVRVLIWSCKLFYYIQTITE